MKLPIQANLSNSINKLANNNNPTDMHTGWLGNGQGVVVVPNSPNGTEVYVRIIGQSGIKIAFNPIVPNIDNLRVEIGYFPSNPIKLQIIRQISYDSPSPNAPIPTQNYHHQQHEYGGWDMVNISKRQYIPFRLNTYGFLVAVSPDYIYTNDQWNLFYPNGTTDLSGLVPGSGSRYVMVSVSSDGVNTDFTTGSVVTNPLTLLDIPTMPYGDAPVAAVRLYQGQTGIYEYTDILDLRGNPFIGISGSYGGGGGTGSYGDMYRSVYDSNHDGSVSLADYATNADKLDGHHWSEITGSFGGSGLQGYYNVKDYGAIGDGSHDDTGAVNSTITAIPSEGGILYFPPGKYKTDGGFTLTKPIIVMGLGSSQDFDQNSGISTIECVSTTGSLFTVSAYGCSFRDMYLENTMVSPIAGAAITVTGGGDLMKFNRLTIHNFYIGIDMQDGWAWSAEQCFILNSVLYDMKVQHVDFVDGGDQSISNCTFWSNNRSKTSAVRIESGGGLKINNCKIVGSGQSGTSYHYGIDLNVGAVVNTADLLVCNTSIENCDINGIRCISNASGPSMWTNLIFTGVQIALNNGNTTALSAIDVNAYLPGDFDNVTIDNCIFSDWSGGVTAASIALTNINHARIGQFTRSGFGSDLSTTNCTDIIQEGNAGFADPMTELGDLIYMGGTASPGNAALSSLGATASGSSYQAPYVYGNVIDGYVDTYWYGGTTPVNTNWIYIDLQTNRPIDRFRMYQAPHTGNSGATKYEVYWSLDAVTWYLATTIFPTADDETINFTETITARYFGFTARTGGIYGWGIYTIELYQEATTYPAKLPIGNEEEVLTVSGGFPFWKPNVGDTQVILGHSGSYSGYANNDSGLASALGDAEFGDSIWLPPGNFAGGFTLPAGVMLASTKNATTITGTITFEGDGCRLRSLNIRVIGSSLSAISGIIGQTYINTTAYIDDCKIFVANNDTNNAYGILMDAGNIQIWNSSIVGNANGGGFGYGVYGSSGLCSYSIGCQFSGTTAGTNGSGNFAIIASSGDATNGQVLTADGSGNSSFQTPSTVVSDYTQGAFVYNSGNFSLPNNSGAAVSFDTEIYDTDSIHDNSTNNTRLTCKTAGKYIITGAIEFASNATGYRQSYIMHTRGATVSYLSGGVITAVNGHSTVISSNIIFDLQVNDYLELVGFHNISGGGALNAVGGGPTACFTSFSMQRIG